MKSHDCQEMKLSYDMKKERKYKWFSWYIMSEYIIVMILVCFNDDKIKTNIKHFALILFFCFKHIFINMHYFSFISDYRNVRF